MGFEIQDGKERLPDEEDIYGVNDAEEREQLEALFGKTPVEERLRRRKVRLRTLAILVIIIFAFAFALVEIPQLFGR